MQVTFFSNFLTHHQTSFGDEMYKQLNGKFTFVSTERMPDAFIERGYPDCLNYPYNLHAYSDDIEFNKALKLGLDSDIVIIGSAPDLFVQERIRQNKHTFRYSERLLKKGEWKLLDPRVLFHLYRYNTIHRSKNLYMLCAGGYTAKDLDLVLAYPGKKFKWGYFTQSEKSNIEQVIAEKPVERMNIIWISRFLDWKHPELAVKLAVELKKRGYNFHLDMIGTGEMVEYIKKLIEKLHVSECISLLGSMPNSEVNNYMQRSNIFIFTSDRNEGWGAVLNEAMGCGCAVVASSTIGAVPFLIEHKRNGLVFKSGSLSGLLRQTESLFKDKLFREKLGKNAFNTIANEWSPKTAASNFLLLSRAIIDGNVVSIEEGPCSKAGWTNRNFWKSIKLEIK